MNSRNLCWGLATYTMTSQMTQSSINCSGKASLCYSVLRPRALIWGLTKGLQMIILYWDPPEHITQCLEMLLLFGIGSIDMGSLHNASKCRNASLLLFGIGTEHYSKCYCYSVLRPHAPKSRIRNYMSRAT
jgi:hypothetical protein